MVELGQKANLGGPHGVLSGQEELQAEEASLVGGVDGASDRHIEVAHVVLVRGGVHALHGLCQQPLRLLEYTVYSMQYSGEGGCVEIGSQGLQRCTFLILVFATAMT